MWWVERLGKSSAAQGGVGQVRAYQGGEGQSRVEKGSWGQSRAEQTTRTVATVTMACCCGSVCGLVAGCLFSLGFLSQRYMKPQHLVGGKVPNTALLLHRLHGGQGTAVQQCLVTWHCQKVSSSEALRPFQI